MTEGIPKNLKNAFQLVLPGDNKGGIILSATTEDDRAKWIEGFNSAIKTAIEDAKKVDAASKRTSGGSHLVQQFNSLQDGGDKMGTIRPSSWSMTMGGRRPLSRSGSTYGTSGTLRGTLKGWVCIICLFWNLNAHAYERIQFRAHSRGRTPSLRGKT